MTQVAVLGLGAMGSGMAHALLRSGDFRVSVYNRSPQRAERFRETEAAIAESAEAAVEKAEVVVVSLADEQAVTDVLSERLLAALPAGAAVIDTSTVSPEFARVTHTRLAAHSVRRVEACLIGNPQMAHNGALRILTAGEQAPEGPAAAVLAACGQEVRYLGAPGRASTVKLAFNLLLGVQTAGLAEAVALVESAGMERNLLLDALDNSGWRSPILSFRGAFMRDRRYQPPGFRAALMHKDLVLAGQEAGSRGVRLPMVELAGQRYQEVMAGGRGDHDAAVVAELPRAGGPTAAG